MTTALWAALGVVSALFLVLLGLAVAAVRSGRRAAARERAARADLEELRDRLDALAAELAEARPPQAPVAHDAEYLITDAGAARDLPQVPERAVLSVTVGEPLVKAAAFGWALRRVLSAESRNRIAFEMRREVKRARKARRRAARRTRLATARSEEAA
ncbi:hypothetical protein [Nocardioides pakistanensis]